jgi:glycerophosphoryl diester phosphodiesterase
LATAAPDRPPEREPPAGHVRIIGHRGMGHLRAGARYAENSIPGFVAALNAGADGIEFDVHLTADDGVIVHHDYRLGRTTEVTEVGGRRLVSHLSAAELTEVPLIGEAKSTLPTLPEVMQSVRPVLGDGEVWVELKRQVPSHSDRRLLERALEILTADPAWPQVVLRSFDHKLLCEARRVREDARVHGLSVTRVEHAVSLASRHGFEGIAVHHRLVHPAFCAPARRAGLTVTAGGQPTEAEIDRLLRQALARRDIDYICTNKVEHALARRRQLELGD